MQRTTKAAIAACSLKNNRNGWLPGTAACIFFSAEAAEGDAPECDSFTGARNGCPFRKRLSLQCLGRFVKTSRSLNDARFLRAPQIIE
jgi:hypothetical protein